MVFRTSIEHNCTERLIERALNVILDAPVDVDLRDRTSVGRANSNLLIRGVLLCITWVLIGRNLSSIAVGQLDGVSTREIALVAL